MEPKIEKLVLDAIEELDYTDCFLVELKVNNTKVEVFLDSDESVTFEKCRKISRLVEAELDENGWLGERYTLEVSSAGVGKPLKMYRQYVKNLGRNIEVKTTDGDKVKGNLKSATEEKIVVNFTETIKEGKKKKKVEVDREVSMVDIKEAKIKVSF